MKTLQLETCGASAIQCFDKVCTAIVDHDDDIACNTCDADQAFGGILSNIGGLAVRLLFYFVCLGFCCCCCCVEEMPCQRREGGVAPLNS